MYNFLEELKWRGMVHDVIPGTDQYLAKNMGRGYIGFDPTADSLHIGNLATLMLLIHFQRAGHKPFILVGGATGLVGDPSGKSAERNLQDKETILHNQACVKAQLEKFLDFNQNDNAAVVVNNLDWFDQMHLLTFLRDIGKHLTINYMMSKDSVKNRLESGLSFTEFSYQLLQAYDFYHLFKNHDVRIQMGGSDQWGNIVGGTELIRRKGAAESFALTAPLITKQDGSKFGKTEQGNIWLDPAKTSPYAFYQFWLNRADDEVIRLMKVFSLKDRQTIEELTSKHIDAPGQRILQNELASELTQRIHNDHELQKAKQASAILFGRSTAQDLQALDEKTLLEVFEGVPKVEIQKNELNTEFMDFLTSGTQNLVFNSKGEAKRMIKSGGLSINKSKVLDDSLMPNFDLIDDKYILLQKGKKNYYLVKVN